MPRFNRQRFSKISFKPFEAEKRDSPRNDSMSPSRAEDVSVKFAIQVPINVNRPNPHTLPPKMLSSNLAEMRTVNGIPSRLKIGAFSRESPLKSREVIVSRSPSFETSFFRKKGSSSHMISEEIMQREHEASRFLSISVGKGKLTRHRTTKLVRQGLPWHSKETKRLSFAKRLQLFRALSREPLSFLDLHVGFGVSKQTIRRLAKNHFLVEVWGPNDIGVQYKLTKEGKNHLKELETAAKYAQKYRKRALLDSRIVSESMP